MYRKFWLTNGKDERYDLTDLVGSAFMNAPSGLGAVADIAVQRVGSSQLLTYLEWQLQPIVGELYFRNDRANITAYQEYKKFFDFVVMPPIYLHYQTPDLATEDWYREVVVVNLEKTEVDKDISTLVCPVQFTPLTNWISTTENLVVATPNLTGGKSYVLNRPYSYAVDDVENIVLQNTYNNSIPIIIEIEGLAEDVNYNLFDFNGIKYGAGRIFGTYDYIYINSNDLEESIALSLNDISVTNPASYQDPTVGVSGQVYVTFLYLRPGQNTMKFLFSNEFDGKITIRWRGNNVTV